MQSAEHTSTYRTNPGWMRPYVDNALVSLGLPLTVKTASLKLIVDDRGRTHHYRVPTYVLVVNGEFLNDHTFDDRGRMLD